MQYINKFGKCDLFKQCHHIQKLHYVSESDSSEVSPKQNKKISHAKLVIKCSAGNLTSVKNQLYIAL